MHKQTVRDQFRLKKFGIALVILLHLVGAIGYVSPLSEWFIYLTPAHLLITAGLIWIDTKPNTRMAWPIAVLIIVFGYLIEIAGVNTGLLFGSYAYGDVLGWKFFSTPPIIGINWLIVTWAGFSFVYSLGIPVYLRWFASAAVITLLDMFIEPVAVHFGYWTWTDGIIPTQNYIAWFIAASLTSIMFEFYPLVIKPRLGVVTFVCQLLFFGFLSYFIAQ